MTEWNEMLDQTLRSYSNAPTPEGLDQRILARVAQKSRRRILLIFAPLTAACVAAMVAAAMWLHQAPLRPQTNATLVVTNSESVVGSAFTAKAELSRKARSRTVRREPDASVIATSPPSVFPAPLPLTAEERRMQALARDGTAIVQPEEPELVISKLNIQPFEANDPTNQGAENEQTEP